MWPVKTQTSVLQTVQIAFVDSCFVFNNLNFQFILFKTECSYQTGFAHLSFCLKAVFSDNIWSSIELVINSDNTFGDNYQKLLIFHCTIFADIWQYLTIFHNVWRRKRLHLKPGNWYPKNIIKYPHLLSSGKEL